MSMNLFFQAFTQQEIDAMDKDRSLIDMWVWDKKRCSISTDIGTAWDVLNKLLSGAGFYGDQRFDDVLLNGCELVFADRVKGHAALLSGWKPEQVLENLRNLEEDDDLYHLEFYREEEEDLLEEFAKLVAFYHEAADQGLAVVHYAA